MSKIAERLKLAGMSVGEPGDNNANPAGEVDKNKAPQGGTETKNDPAAAADKDKAGESANNSQTSPSTEPDDVDIDDAKMLKAYNKKFNTNFTSLDDINKPAASDPVELTDEQKRIAKEAKKDKIAAFGLQKGKVTKSVLDAYARDAAKDPIELAYQLFRANLLQEHKDAKTPKEDIPSEDAMYSEFEEYNHLNAGETDPKRQRRERELLNVADNYLQQTYKSVYDLEDDYDEFEQTTQSQTAYNASVQSAMTSIPTEYSYDIPDENDPSGKTMLPYKYKTSPEVLSEIRSRYESPEMFNLLSKQGKVTPEFISKAIQNEFLLKNFNKIVAEVAHAHASAKIAQIKMGRRNIVELPGSTAGKVPGSANTATQRLLEKNKALIDSN